MAVCTTKRVTSLLGTVHTTETDFQASNSETGDLSRGETFSGVDPPHSL
jgi:hypothetical protein